MSGPVVIVGLGPAGLDRLTPAALSHLHDPAQQVVLRTLEHPAARELAEERQVVTCDDLYEAAADFDTVYQTMCDRVMDMARHGPVVYAVPGSSLVGERAVRPLAEAAAASGWEVIELPGESFLDLLYARTGADPIGKGVQVLDARNLPDPLPLHVPTVITQVDRGALLSDVTATLGRVLPMDTEVTFLDSLGSADERVVVTSLTDAARLEPGPRTSLYLDPPPAGWHGLVVTNRILRVACPWDREQTHHTLVSHLIEETYETVEAISQLSTEAPAGEPDYGAYAELEEELGDLLLQVVFHATLAAEAGAFDVEEIAEGVRLKLVARHPHVFGDVEADTASQVKQNWERIKHEEKSRDSLMDDIPTALPSIARADKVQRRAASVGFDWSEPRQVLDKLDSEVAELSAAVHARDGVGGSGVEATADELGDVLFSAVNLARHLSLDPEMALRAAADKFSDRFRAVEAAAAASGRSLDSYPLDELNELWEEAKRATAR